ncbi:NUDIX hydrolase [Skermanella mucosa]|uniref:NUDIX domain-containing protein n=1 Tax=Skermanella mucosa TaxID=1789672 RepID=UPI00192AC2A4|nr:NUDIX hydrolase [Skermanella mucosa]UEM22296.1 NUDIX hydrolase [Skermanella mucosa]
MPHSRARHPAVTTLPAVSEENPWKTLSGEVRYENKWIRVTEHQVVNPSGNPGIYGVVHFKSVAIGVLPVDAEGCVHLVGQYRYSLNAYSWEMPEGGGAPDMPPIEEAKRELREETGLVARQWLELLPIHTSNSICDEHGVIYLAWDMELTESEPEETEQLTIVRMPFASVVDLVMEGAITDSMTVAAVLKAQLLAERGALPEALSRLMLRR